MATSDNARISFDPSRQYRSVVAQQGRVTLEADVNEQASIGSEALRLATIDVVGPAGTPDNGYEVSAKPNGVVQVGAGTMYAGGWRLRLPAAVTLDQQPDWLDQPAGTVGDVVKQQLDRTELVALLVIEQTVTAVEDEALREVALGGPDTAARTRLMQRFIHMPTHRDTCGAASTDLTKQLALEGLVFHPKTLELTFDAGLEVSFFPPAPPADPCCPPAQGGYLGSDNQLVRVTVTEFDAATGAGKLVWGWNNASFLYRATLVAANGSPQILTLAPAPIDGEHTPQPGQVIEVLRTSCVLTDVHGDNDEDYIAALQGELYTLGSGSVFDTGSNQLTLPAASTLPDDYEQETYSLFVRIWQSEVAFTLGTATALDTTSGLAVTLKMKALPTAPFDARPYWQFAMRPNSPQAVYPQRYQEGMQGPDGPRQWLCELALVERSRVRRQKEAESARAEAAASKAAQKARVIADCRVKFVPLSDIDGDDACCGVTLGPAEVTARGGLQAVIDAQAKKKQPLALRAGHYVLREPLKLGQAHSGFTLSGCGGGLVKLTAAEDVHAKFAAGILVLRGAKDVTLQGLDLVAAAVVRSEEEESTEARQAVPATKDAPRSQIGSAIGIYIEDSTDASISECSFTLNDSGLASERLSVLIGACIFAQGDCSGLRLERNTFASVDGDSETSTAIRLLFGLWMMPTAEEATGKTNLFLPASAVGTRSAEYENSAVESSKKKLAQKSQTGAGTAKTATMTTAADGSQKADVETTAAAYARLGSNAVLKTLTLEESRFTGLTMAALVMARLGQVRCACNVIMTCCGGLMLLDSDIGPGAAFGRKALEEESKDKAGDTATVRQMIQPEVLATAAESVTEIRTRAATTLTSIHVADTNARKPAAASAALSGDARETLLRSLRDRGGRAFDELWKQRSVDVADTTSQAAQGTAAGKAETTTVDAETDSTPDTKATTAEATTQPASDASDAEVSDQTAEDKVKLAYGSLETLGLASELIGDFVVPLLTITGNDITLVPAAKTGTDRSAAASLPGILVMFSERDRKGDLFLTGNRVQAPNARSLAAGVLWGATHVISSNILMQQTTDAKAGTPSAVLVLADGRSVLVGNVVHPRWLVLPARNVSVGTDSWAFLNTIG